MKSFKLTLIDNDDRSQANADLALDTESADAFSNFIASIKEELVTGQTERIEIEGNDNDTVRLCVNRCQ